MQKANIWDIFKTLLVLKFDKSSCSNILQLSNINDISSTLLVSNDDNLILFKNRHSWNIWDIFIVFCVLKLEKSKEVKEEQK